MNPDLPPLTWLRAFEAAARTLSFTHAASELHLTQAAVSKHVKSLELHLSQPLFTRHPRSLTLTKSGAAYLPKVQDALERLAIGTREVFGRRRETALTLRCAVSFAVNWLSPRLPDWLDRNPRTPLRILSSVWNDPADKDGFDLDIRYGTGHWPGWTGHRLTREHLTPLCAPGVRLPSPGDLRRQRLLHVLGYQDGWGVWLNAAGVGPVDEGLHLDTSLAAFAIAARGGGVALGRSSLIAPELDSGRLVAPFDLAVPVTEAFHLLVRDGGGDHPATAAFAAWVISKADPRP